MDTTSGLIALGILIILSGIFSGVEAAYLSLSRIKVKRLVKLKRKNADYVKNLKDDSHRLIITLLIGNNLVNIGASAIATAVAIELYGSKGIGIATGVMTFMILIFGEIIPKSKAIQHAEWICLKFAKILTVLKKILYPLIVLFDFLTRRFMGKMEGRPLITEEELKSFVEIGEETGSIEKDEKEMIHNIFKLNDLEVREVMTPKINVESIELNNKLKDVVDLVTTSVHSRIPVYDENPEKIVGVLHIKDTLKYLKDRKLDVKISVIMQKPLVVPETKDVDDLLREMQNKAKHMAIVVDEYGTVAGIVTIEDILEEIVGEIYDETDVIEKNIVKIDKKTARVKGETSIDEVNRMLKTKLKMTNGYDTISGLVLKKLGEIPAQGDEVELKNMKIVVERVVENRISQVRIMKK